MKADRRTVALYVVVFLIATAGLVYELVCGAVASYLLGDSVTHFSLVIGAYLSALGVGAYGSKLVERDVAARFVDLEAATALVGGLSAPVLFLSHGRSGAFSFVLWVVVGLTGTLVGMELPLLMRLLRERVRFEDLVAKALFFDYLGALAASVLFALVLVPTLGMIRTSLLFGAVNAAVGIATTFVLSGEVGSLAAPRARCAAVLVALVALYSQADRLLAVAESGLYADPVVFAAQSRYARVVLTKGDSGVALHLDNNLQFSSADEHRYHEALVHPAVAALGRPPRRAMIGGGGDGLAARELLRYPSIERVVLVDLDPGVTALARTRPELARANGGALDDARVTVVHADAARHVEEDRAHYDVIVLDFPDPNSLSLGKLFSTRMMRATAARLADGGVMAVQSTSPFYARDSFSTVVATAEASGLHALPYRVFLPSFGEWGFVLAKREAFDPPRALAVTGLRYLDDDALASLFVWPADVAPRPAAPNTRETQRLVRTYEREMSRYQP